MSSFKSQRQGAERPDVPWDGLPKTRFLAGIRDLLDDLSVSFTDPEVIQLKEEVLFSIIRFSDSFYEKLKYLEIRKAQGHMGDEDLLSDFVKACKRRCDDLTYLLGNLSVLENEVELFLASKETAIAAESVRYISGKSRIFAVSEDSDDPELVYTIHKTPKWYTPLFIGVIKCIDLGHYRSDYNIQSKMDCEALANVLISVGRIYNNIRSDTVSIMKQEREALDTMAAGVPYEPSESWIALRDQVLKDIVDSDLLYVQRFRVAMEATEDIRKSPFGFEDYFVSTKAATTRRSAFKVRKQISFLNSCFERDPMLGHVVQSAIGYLSHYNLNAPPDLVERVMKTCSIDQHKYKRRIIKMAINAVQDICNYIHRRAKKFLAELPTDCTNNQGRGVTFAQRITSPAYRRQRQWPSIYCTDITDATGTISQEFELKVMELLWIPELVQFWQDVLATPQTFVFYDGTSESYIQRVGQPQGLGGSFELFSIDHHILMLMLMKHRGLENIDSLEFYRLLGDDDIINTIVPDIEDTMLDDIEFVYGGANWAIEKSKCKITRRRDAVAIAEFAKVTVIDGRISTPPPIRLVSQYAHPTRQTYGITACLWMQLHGFPMQHGIKTFLDRWFSYNRHARNVAEAFVHGGVSQHFNCFKYPSLMDRDHFRMQVAFCYLVTKIRGTFVEVLTDKDARNNLDFRSDDWMNVSKKMFGRLKPEMWLDSIENPLHKVRQLINRNLAIRDAMICILEDENAPLLAAGMDLTDTERDTIRTVSELLVDVKEFKTLPDYTFGVIRTLLKRVESFNRFQMRGITKSSGREASYLTEVIRLHKEMFPDAENMQLQTGQ